MGNSELTTSRNRLTLRHSGHCLIWLFLWLIDLPLAAAQEAPSLAPAIDTLVMLNGSLRGVDSYGAGIVFARKEQSLYIASANHLVRSGEHEMTQIEVRLKALPDKALPARLLKEQSLELDLALLQVRLPEGLKEPVQFDFHLLADSAANLADSLVYPVGNVGHRPWSRPFTPSQGVDRDGDRLRFESTFVGRGASGGGLVEESGVLLGMLINDNPPYGEAIDIHGLIATIKAFGYPVDLSPAYGYEVADKWEGSGLFQMIFLERQGERVGGRIDSSNTEFFGAIGAPKTQFIDGGIVSETVMFYGLSGDIAGELRGNRLRLDVMGSWLQHVTVVGGKGSGIPQSNRVKFSARLDGLVKANEIDFDYVFDYGAVGDNTRGSFVAKRKITPQQKAWQVILEEVIRAHRE